MKYYSDPLKISFFRLNEETKDEEKWSFKDECWIPYSFFLQMNDLDEIESKEECEKLIQQRKIEREIGEF